MSSSTSLVLQMSRSDNDWKTVCVLIKDRREALISSASRSPLVRQIGAVSAENESMGQLDYSRRYGARL